MSAPVAGCLVLLATMPAYARQAPMPVPTVTLEVNGGFRVSGSSFEEQASPVIHAEAARIETTYDVDGGVGISLGGAYRVWRQLSVGLNYATGTRSTEAEISAAIPHPFVFNRPRQISGAVTNAERKESTLAIDARMFIPLTSRMAMAVFGGPAWISVTQDLVQDLDFEETYPYDTATFGSARLGSAEKTQLGFTLGGDVSIYLSKQFGAGVGLRYSRANMDLPTLGGGTVNLKAGGVDVNVGVRFRF